MKNCPLHSDDNIMMYSFQASEEAIVKLRNSAAVATDHLQQQQQSHHHHHQIYYVVNQILYPVVQGCETKEPKIVKVCTILHFSCVFNNHIMLPNYFLISFQNDIDVSGNYSKTNHTPSS